MRDEGRQHSETARPRGFRKSFPCGPHADEEDAAADAVGVADVGTKVNAPHHAAAMR